MLNARKTAQVAMEKAGETALAALAKVGEISEPAVRAHIARFRSAHPEASPDEIIKRLEHEFTAAVTLTGAGVGAVAAAPAVGTGPALAFALGDSVAYIGVAGLYVLALADIYDIPIEDVERRRTLILGVLLGDAGSGVVEKMAGRTGAHWGKKIVAAVPVATLRKINAVLGRNFITKYGTKQGILVLGKTIPFGIGMLIGGAGNAAFAQFTIRSAHRAFGPTPKTWPAHLGPAGGEWA